MIIEALATAKIHLKRAKFSFNQLQKIDINPDLFEDEEKVKTVDAFIFRFIKLQDFMGDRLFRQLLETLGEYKDSMSLLDVLDRMEKLMLMPNSDDWMEYRKVRNKLTHEYSNNKSEIIEGLKLAFLYFIEIEKILYNIENYLNQNDQIQ